MPIAFNKLAPAQEGLVGICRPADDGVVALTFLADGRFALMESGEEPNRYETGTYGYNAASGMLTFVRGFDSNDGGGIFDDEHDGSGSVTFTASIDEGELLLEYGGDQLVLVRL